MGKKRGKKKDDKNGLLESGGGRRTQALHSEQDKYAYTGTVTDDSTVVRGGVIQLFTTEILRHSVDGSIRIFSSPTRIPSV